MKIEILQDNKPEKKLSFVLKDSSVAFANMLRKYIIAKVPTMAIETVEFRKNSSILYDEVLAHRLGLIPLVTDLKSYVLPEKCKCKGEGCAKCTLKLTLTAKGAAMIEAGKIKSQDPKVVPVFENMPIVKLLEDQKVQFEATATLGRGEEHSKWSPGQAYYKYLPNIVIKKSPKNPQAVVDSCPLKIFELDKSGKLKTVKDRETMCHLCGACIDVSEKAVDVESTGKDFIFNIESWGQLSCREMVLQALSYFKEELGGFETIVKGLK